MTLFQAFGQFAGAGAGAPPALEAFDYIDTLTLSAAASGSIDNVFSADYDHYLLLNNIDGTSNSNEIEFRYRASSSDATGSNYVYQQVSANGGTLGSARVTRSAHVWTWNSGTATDNNIPPGWLMVSNPFQAVLTTSFNYGSILFDTPGLQRHYLLMNSHQVSTSYDGFTLFTTIGTLSGTVQFYGWKV